MIQNIFFPHKTDTMSITERIILSVLLCSSILLLIWYFYVNYSLIDKEKEHLQKIAYSTEDVINAYLKKSEEHATFLSHQKEVNDFLDTIDQNGVKSSITALNQLLSSQQNGMEFKNILLIDDTKTVRYAYATKQIVGKKLTDTAYKNALLSMSYERAMMSLTPDFSEYGHDPLFQTATLFICIPIIENKKFKGILAYECDVSKITNFSHEYISLGSSGEIIVGYRKKSSIIFLAPSRYDRDLAFKRKKLSKKTIPLEASVLGIQGSGISLDYRNKPVVAAWTFIPKVNWGIVIKKDVEEINGTINFIFMLFIISAFCTLLWILFLSLRHKDLFSDIINSLKNIWIIKTLPACFKNPLLLLIFLFFFLLLKTIFAFYHTNQTHALHETDKITNDIKNGAEEINQILNKITFTTQSLADDLKLNRLSPQDLIKRLQRDAAENENILSLTVAFAPHAYDKDKKLYAPTISKQNNNAELVMLEDEYDYSDPDEHNIKTAWYRKAVTNKFAWINNRTVTEHGKIKDPTYSLAFFNQQKELMGVVCVTYSFDIIEKITGYSSLDRKGYSFLLSSNNIFLSHPIKNLVAAEKTILDYAIEQDSPSLINLADEISHTESQFVSYTQGNSTLMWMYTEPIATNSWILGAIFSKEDISLPAMTIRHYCFAITVYALIVLALISLYCFKQNLFSLSLFAIVINLLLVLSLMALWKTIQSTPDYKTTKATIITDQASVDKFLDDLESESQRKNEEQPIKIPCGLIIYSIDMPHMDNMTISGYIWNKYNIHEKITHQIKIPHATKLIIDSPTTAVNNNTETVTWNIRGTIYEKQNYKHFPFDRQQMQITLEHHDIDKNIILVPDLEDYKKISPEDTPGLDKNFTLSEFHIEETFFMYKKIDPVVNFGFTQYGKTTDHFQLIYNLIITRGLLSPFILYFLPLLVLLFSLFSILVIAKRTTEPLAIISPYTGLFFALVLLHRSLREHYSTGATLYMEYSFFFAYITIILLVIHTMFIYLYPEWKQYQEKVFPLAKLLFWPLQLAAWLVTTIIIFY